MSDAVAQSPESSQVDKQIRIESLLFLYRSMPSAALGHSVTGGFITFALYDVVDRDTLFFWLAAIISVSIIRLIATNFLQRRLIGLSETSVNTWAQILAAMTFVQTSIWGLSVFLIWPDDIAYRSVLIAILAGIIAAGGIMLALHRRSFWIYCLPISVPAVIQLVIGGTEIELVLASLLAFYSVLLLVSVNRLTNVFLEMLRLRFLMQSESRTDALTGLANRRGFDESLHDLWQQSIRSSQSLGLLSIDIDYFKNYNDYYGHPQGDVALKSFADMLKRVISRSTDVWAAKNLLSSCQQLTWMAARGWQTLFSRNWPSCTSRIGTVSEVFSPSALA